LNNAIRKCETIWSKLALNEVLLIKLKLKRYGEDWDNDDSQNSEALNKQLNLKAMLLEKYLFWQLLHKAINAESKLIEVFQ